MLTESHIEAFDEELADKVWEDWLTGEIDDITAYLAWWRTVCNSQISLTETQ